MFFCKLGLFILLIPAACAHASLETKEPEPFTDAYFEDFITRAEARGVSPADQSKIIHIKDVLAHGTISDIIVLSSGYKQFLPEETLLYNFWGGILVVARVFIAYRDCVGRETWLWENWALLSKTDEKYVLLFTGEHYLRTRFPRDIFTCTEVAP